MKPRDKGKGGGLQRLWERRNLDTSSKHPYPPHTFSYRLAGTHVSGGGDNHKASDAFLF